MGRIKARPPLWVSEASWLFALHSLRLKPGQWSYEATRRWSVFHLGSSSEPGAAARDKEGRGSRPAFCPRSQSPMKSAPSIQLSTDRRGVQDYDGGALAGRSGKQVLIPSPSPGYEPLAAFQKTADAGCPRPGLVQPPEQGPG